MGLWHRFAPLWLNCSVGESLPPPTHARPQQTAPIVVVPFTDIGPAADQEFTRAHEIAGQIGAHEVSAVHVITADHAQTTDRYLDKWGQRPVRLLTSKLVGAQPRPHD